MSSTEGLSQNEININLHEKATYITQANAKQILRKININDIKNVEQDIFEKPIYFLSKWETNYLLHIKSLLKNPEKYFIEVYQPIENKDTFHYVYETKTPPSYHYDKNCQNLSAVFRNFVIPQEIKDRTLAKAEKEGNTSHQIEELVQQQVQIFRSWFKSHFQLFTDDLDEFLKKLDIRWNVQRKIHEIELQNSGTALLDNFNLEELKASINKIIDAAGAFFNNNASKQHIIRRFQKLTFLAYKETKIDYNNTALSDAELKQFLREYDKSFKEPIKQLLIQYYRIKYNPELSFKGRILKQLNFRACSLCCSNVDK